MKFVKYIVSLLLSSIIISQSISTFADDVEFNPDEEFKDYTSYDDSQVNESWHHYYVVSKSNDDNSKALFSENKQITDFIYESINIENCGIIVSQKKDNIEYFGFLSDDDYTELLPIKYISLENYEVEGYLAKNVDGSFEYYIIKTPIEVAGIKDIKYSETDKLYVLTSYEDLQTALGVSNIKSKIIPIEGLDNCYIMEDTSGFYVNIVNEKNQKLVETNFRKVEDKAGNYNTIIVYYPEGMTDSSIGLLSKDFKTIVPKNFYSNINFIIINNNIYVEAISSINNSKDYYDLKGNKINIPEDYEISTSNMDNSYSN